MATSHPDTETAVLRQDLAAAVADAKDTAHRHGFTVVFLVEYRDDEHPACVAAIFSNEPAALHYKAVEERSARMPGATYAVRPHGVFDDAYDCWALSLV